jgi:hypothetical protein
MSKDKGEKDAEEGYDAGKDEVVADYGTVDGTRPPISVKLRSYGGGNPRVTFTRTSAKGKEYPLKRLDVAEAVALGAFLTDKLANADAGEA